MDSLLFLYDFHFMYDLFEYFGFKKSCPDPPYHSNYRFLHDFFEYYFQKSHTNLFPSIPIITYCMTFSNIISKKVMSTFLSFYIHINPIYPHASNLFQEYIPLASAQSSESAQGAFSITEADLYSHLASRPGGISLEMRRFGQTSCKELFYKRNKPVWPFGVAFSCVATFKNVKRKSCIFCSRSNCLSPFMGEFWSENRICSSEFFCLECQHAKRLRQMAIQVVRYKKPPRVNEISARAPHNTIICCSCF